MSQEDSKMPLDMEEPVEISSESDCEMEESEEKPEPEPTEEQKALAAEYKKEQGNEFYKKKLYPDALQLYTDAIDLCPNCVAYYGNRSACYLMLGQYARGLEDARKSTRLDPEFVKGHLREAKCHLAMGEVVAAVMAYQRVLQLDPNNNTAVTELQQSKRAQQHLDQADISFRRGEYRHVVFCMDRCIEMAPGCFKFKVLKAECLALLKRYQESQEIANDILRMDMVNADAIYVRGLCLYYQDSIEKAFQHFQQVLRLAPDHQKAREVYKKAKQLLQKKEEGNAAFRAGHYAQAHTLYSEALAIDPNNIFTNSKLYNNRATVSVRLGKSSDAIKDCSSAIELDDAYQKAYMRRAKCYLDTEQYDEAVRDYEKIYKMDKNRETKKLLQDAKLELKKSKRKDYYKVLGVGKSATEDEIKKAYRKRALLHHPDRHSSATEEDKKAEEKKFKEIGEAYSILSDPKKKQRYDSGQDLEDLEGHNGFSDIDPNLIFQSFFGGPGGPGGPGFGFQQQQQQQQPGFGQGGFTFQFG